STVSVGAQDLALASLARLVLERPAALQTHLNLHVDPIYACDELGNFVLANDAAGELFGYAREDLIGVSLLEISAALEYQRYPTEQTASGGIECEIVDARGRRRFFEEQRHVINDHEMTLSLTLARETTRQRRLEALTRDHTSLLGLVIRDADDGLVFSEVARMLRRHLDASTVAVWIRERGHLRFVAGDGISDDHRLALRSEERDAHLLDVTEEAAVLYNGAICRAPCPATYRRISLDGHAETWLSVAIRTKRMATVGLIDVLLPQRSPANEEQADVATSGAAIAALAVEHHRRAAELSFQRTHDRLTKILNREGLLATLSRTLAHAARSKETVAVLAIDLDEFRRVNEQLGHQLGDALLQETVDRLERCKRGTDHLARVTGDEFVLVLTALEDPNGAAAVAGKVQRALRAPYEVAGHRITLGATIGISLYPTDAPDGRGLLERAIQAKHDAKRDGKGTYCYFSPDLHAKASRRQLLLEDLRTAIDTEQLHIDFQPQLDLATDTTKGYEVLVRWNHPMLGAIRPDEFIAIAESEGLIIDLDTWVLHESCMCAREWLDLNGDNEEQFSVNVAAAQFTRDDFVREVSLALRRSGLPAYKLELEVTESMVVRDLPAMAQRIEQIREMGVKVALDDFGTGHAGFQYLMELPADRLKIDKAFVEHCVDENGRRQRSALVLRGIIDLAHSLGMDVVVEGVETEAQLEFMKRCGCNYVQGWVYARSFPVRKALEALKTPRLSRI
ncbi:MAG: diguanylate cyclase (GGDEF)-like protein/PAS domain S-box-containing protein, partial [Flavobacteriales bacterium]